MEGTAALKILLHFMASLTTVQYIFLIYGATTVLCGAMVFFGLPDSPTKAWFLTAEEKQLAVVRLADNQTGIETRKVIFSEASSNVVELC